MARSLNVDIAESVEYLEKSLRQARLGSQKEKLQMLWWLKSGQVRQHQEIAERLGRNPSTITRWLQVYRREGLATLLAIKKSPGRPRKIDQTMLPQLQARLAQPEGFKSYGQIQQWVETELGKSVTYKTVHKTVRYDLKAKLKVPRPQSIQQDPHGVALFKKTSHLPC